MVQVAVDHLHTHNGRKGWWSSNKSAGLEKKIALGHWEDFCGLATQFHAVGFDHVRFGIDLDFGEGVVPDQVVF